MIERFRLWFYQWLRLDVHEVDLSILKDEMAELRAEVARMKVERYVPPQTEEPKPKVIKTQTFKQFQDILEREQEESNAV